MRRSFKDADFDALAALWNDFYPPQFRIDPELLRQNTVGSPLFDWGASMIEEKDGRVCAFAAVKRSAAPLYKGPQPDTEHLTAIAFRDPQAGVELLAEVKRVLVDRGVQKLAFGSDSRHFFPGCPIDHRGLCSFLMVEGFVEGDEAFDLERDLRDYTIPVTIPEGVDFRPAVEADHDALVAFFDQEFAGRWKYDVLDKIRVEGYDCVYGAFRDGECIGFALLQDWRHRQPIAGAVWRNDLGEHWGSLGPIGISSRLRGGGIGHGLLGKALEEQRNRGVHRCIIDWTTLKDFYGRHGFEVTRVYRYHLLTLSD